MAVTATNLIWGPASIYSGAFGATEPLDTAVGTAPDSGVWTDCGGTTNGVTLTVKQKFKELDVDQIVDIPGRRLTQREFQIQTEMAEPTLANLTLSMNGGTAGSGSGYASLEPAYASSANTPNYYALLIDGYAPNSFRRRVIARKVINADDVATAYVKDKQTVLKVTFSAHYVSSSIAPFKIVDQTS